MLLGATHVKATRKYVGEIDPERKHKNIRQWMLEGKTVSEYYFLFFFNLNSQVLSY